MRTWFDDWGKARGKEVGYGSKTSTSEIFSGVITGISGLLLPRPKKEQKDWGGEHGPRLRTSFARKGRILTLEKTALSSETYHEGKLNTNGIPLKKV